MAEADKWCADTHARSPGHPDQKDALEEGKCLGFSTALLWSKSRCTARPYLQPEELGFTWSLGHRPRPLTWELCGVAGNPPDSRIFILSCVVLVEKGVYLSDECIS